MHNCKGVYSHAPGMGLLPAKGLPVKDAARIAHFALAVRLRERERTGAMGGPFPLLFFCMPFSALHGVRSSTSVRHAMMACCIELCITALHNRCISEEPNSGRHAMQ